MSNTGEFQRVINDLTAQEQMEIGDYKSLSVHPGWVRIVRKLKENLSLVDRSWRSNELKMDELTTEKAMAITFDVEISKRMANYLEWLISLPETAVEEVLKNHSGAIPKNKKKTYA